MVFSYVYMVTKLSSLCNSKTTHHPKKQLRVTSSHSSFSPPPTPGNLVYALCLFSKASRERGLDTKAVRLPWRRNRTVLPESEWKEIRMDMKVKVTSLSRVQLFATPWTVAYQASPSLGLSRPEYWSGLPFPSPEDLPNPGIEPRSPTW